MDVQLTRICGRLKSTQRPADATLNGRRDLVDMMKLDLGMASLSWTVQVDSKCNHQVLIRDLTVGEKVM